MLTGSIWEWGTEAVLAYCVYWGWHVHRYRKIGCARCEGKGSFMSESLVRGHPVKRPCPKCGGDPWRRRKWAPEDEG